MRVLKSNDADCISVVQITDTHIFADPLAEFDGINPSNSLSAVINNIQSLHSDYDFIIASGDLVHEPDTNSYGVLRQHLKHFDKPVYCLAGNHDDPSLMQTVLNSDGIYACDYLNVDNWLLVFLNSCVKDSHSGNIDSAQLEQLADRLDNSRAEHVMICLHHHPLPIGSLWMDQMMLENADELFSIIDQSQLVRAMIWGHTHQQFEAQRGQIRMMGTPSTCTQFKPMTDAYEKDDLSPGYRKIYLYKDGEVESEVCRVEL